MRYITLFSLILACVRYLFAQDLSLPQWSSYDLKFESLTIDDGLSQSTVQCILQDRKGFLWIGTQDGLNRYDGYNFTIFKNDDRNPQSVSANWIAALCEDRRGYIWVGTNNGLNRFDPRSETFVHYQHRAHGPKSLSNNNVRAIYEDRQGLLWMGTAGGLDRFDLKNETFQHYQHDENNPHSLSYDWVTSIHEDANGDLWIGTEDGLNRFNRSAGSFSRFTPDPENPHVKGNNWVTAILEDQNRSLWIGTRDGGLAVLEKDASTENTFRHYRADSQNPNSLGNNSVQSIFEDVRGLLWIGTAGGLDLFDRDTGLFRHYRNNPQNPRGLSANDVTSIYKDESTGLWIGTLGGGLNRLDLSPKQFTHYKNDPQNTNSLSDNTVWSILEDRTGSVWIGTGNGLNRYDPKTARFRHYRNDANNPKSLSNNIVWSIFEDHEGMLWVGTENGLNRYDRPNESFQRYKHDRKNPSTLSHQWIMTIYEDRAGVLWVGTWGGGLNRFDRATGTFKEYRHDPNDSLSLSHNSVTVVTEDRAGTMWIGTEDGLNRFNRHTDTFLHYHHNLDNPKSLSLSWVTSIYEDSSGVLWLGTFGGGLNRFDLETESFSHFRESDGLANDVVYGILADNQGNLWLSTNNGISRFNPKDRSFKNYDVSDGLQSNEFNSGAYFRSRNGKMYFGGVNGFNVFHPDSIRDNPFVPPVVVTRFSRFNTDDTAGVAIEEKGVSAREEIELTYKDNILVFEVAALNFRNPGKNLYAYKLEGFNDNWIQLGARREFTFTNLDPDAYTLHVRGSNDDGVWNEKGVSVKIAISPPWWRTWWAYGFYALCVLGLLYSLRWYELRQQKRELEQERKVSERLRQVDKLKDEFLDNTSHKLRTPLNGIIGLTESLIDNFDKTPRERTRANLGMIAASGKRLTTLVNDILDFSKLKTHHIELQKRPVDLRVLTDIVLRFSETLLAGKNLILKNEIPENMPAADGDENRLQQILHNLIDNAVKFTESGAVTVSAHKNNGMIEVAVADTGIGISKEKFETIFRSFEQADASTAREYGGTGLGLAITKKLVELHGGEIRLDAEIGEGTTVTFTLPIAEGKPTTATISDLAKVRAVGSAELGVRSEESGAESIPTLRTPYSQLPAQTGGDFNILIVDDEPVNQQVLANHLSQVNYDFKQAFNGEEALRYLESGEKFDLILLDIMMPKMSGYEVCQRIRARFLPTEMPVIMVTAKDQLQDLVQGLESGANDYLAKPFSKAELLARIKTHLNLHNINRAYGRFVPREFLSYLNKESIVDVKLGDNAQAEMTIFVSDIRSFTAISEKMTPAENFAFINEYMGLVSPIIRDHHGFIDRYTGDAVMALFPRSAEDAIANAIATLNRLEQRNTAQVRAKEMPVQIGIGLNTGSLMLGIVGEKKRMQGDIFSDAVNLAHRLEGLSKRYGVSIVASEATLDKLKNRQAYHTRFLGKIQVKGKQTPVSVFEIFDGDPQQTIDLKLKTKADFEQGLAHYVAKEFAEASVCFNNVLQQNPEDKTAKLYLERSAQFMVQGVPDSWEGVEAIEGK